MSNAALKIAEPTEDPPNFGGLDKNEIYDGLDRILDVQIGTYLTEEQNQNLGPAFDLYFKVDHHLERPNPETAIKNNLEFIGTVNAMAYAKLRNIRSLMPIVAAIWADRNRPDDAGHNGYNIEAVAGMAAKSGLSFEDFLLFLERSTIWKTITPHPTETLNAAGVKYFRELIAAGELPADERQEAAEKIIHKMLREDVTPQRKNNTFEETDSAIEQAVVYRKGQREFSARLKSAVQKAYGDKCDISELEKRMPKIALHLWHGGADTDGKLNADRWARLYGMIAITRTAAREHLEDIRAAKELARQDQALSGQFTILNGQYEMLEQALEAIEEKFKGIEEKFVVTNAEGVKSLREGADYAAIKRQFEIDSNSFEMEGQKFASSEKFSEAVLQKLGRLAERTESPEAKKILRESENILSNYGLAAALLETRHNGKVYADIFDNLFADGNFQTELNKIYGEFKWQDKKFSDLPEADRLAVLHDIEQDMSPEKIVESLRRANPMVLEGSGLPLQTHEFLELFALTKVSPEKFGELALISEADSGVSSAYQNFIMNAFDLKNFIHTPLNEDYENARKIPQNLADYHKGSGKQNALTRAFSSVKGAIRQISQAVMMFCSDANKEYGRAVTYLNAECTRGTAMQGILSKIRVLMKLGNGFASGRCGGDPMVTGRYMAETIRDYAEQRAKAGKPLDPQNFDDRSIMSMASFLSHTEQGRAIRFYSSTPAQVKEAMSNQIGEMLGRHLEILGHVKKGYFIPVPDKFSDNMRELLHAEAHGTMRYYSSMRHAVPVYGTEPVTNTWAEKIMGDAKKLMPFANNSARAASKEAGGKAKGLVDERAIGNQRTNIILRSNHDDYFGCGKFMRGVHNAFLEKKITAQDVEAFALKSPWWRRQFFSRGLPAVVRSDLAHGFEKMGVADKWDFDRCMEVGARCRLEPDEWDPEEFHFSYSPQHSYDGEGVIPYEATETPEEAYQAMLVYDQACFAALTEAALCFKEYQDFGRADWGDAITLESPFDLPLTTLLQYVRPNDGSVGVALGERTKERLAWLADIEKREDYALADKVLIEYAADHLDELSEADKRLVMANIFSATHPDTRMVLGRTEYGYLQTPDVNNALTPKPFENMVFAASKKSAINDNKGWLGQEPEPRYPYL